MTKRTFGVPALDTTKTTATFAYLPCTKCGTYYHREHHGLHAEQCKGKP